MQDSGELEVELVIFFYFIYQSAASHWFFRVKFYEQIHLSLVKLSSPLKPVWQVV